MKGQVVDSITGKPLPNVELVFITSTTMNNSKNLIVNTKTDAKGKYKIKLSGCEYWNVNISAEGYQPLKDEKISYPVGSQTHFTWLHPDRLFRLVKIE